MSDADLQAAILQSLAPAPAARSSGFTASFGQGGRASSGGAGGRRRATLVREGILPAGSRAIPSQAAAPRRRSTTHLQRRSSAPAPASAPRGRALAMTPLGDGWAQHGERGTFQRCGLHTVVEGRAAHFHVCTYGPKARAEALRGASYDLQLSVKAAKAQDPGPHPSLDFTVVFGFEDAGSFYMVRADATSQQWRLEMLRDGAVTTVEAVHDSTLRANSFYQVLLQVRGAHVTVDANGVPIFSHVRMDRPLAGAVGVAALRSKLVFKGLTLSAVGGTTAVREPVTPGETSKAAAAAAAGSSPAIGVTAASDDERPLAGRAPYTGDEQQIIDIVERDIFTRDLSTTFDDIASLHTPKRLLNEAVVLPLLVPEFFVGIREPWKGVLLFGPPGTGKTMLAKAVAGMNGTTFFNCSAASLVSKFRGQSEKIVRCLFGMARHFAPSIIFIDEVDSLVGSRTGDGEHEASRRLKTELFTQMDGVLSSGGASGQAGGVCVLATTNCPWALDEAMRRRFEKRVHVPLPDLPARVETFRLNLRSVAVADDVSVTRLARLTEGYSGADIHSVCREAAMMPMRRAIAGLSPSEIQAAHQSGALSYPPMSQADLEEAVGNTRPSVSATDHERYAAWMAEFGST